MTDTRYPYTYACDLIRGAAGYCDGSTKLSRSDASAIRAVIAKAIGMDDADMANKLADYFKANDEFISSKAGYEFLVPMVQQ